MNLWPFGKKFEQKSTDCGTTLIGLRPAQQLEEVSEVQKVQISREELKVKYLEDSVETLLQRLSILETKNKKLESRIEVNSNLNKELATTIIEILETIDEESSGHKNRRKKDLEVFNKNFKFLQKQNTDIAIKFDGLLEVIAEKISERDEALPDIFAHNTTVRKILTSSDNKQKGALFALVFLAKKYFEEKGMKL